MSADGSIIINTELDDKKAQAELNKLEKQVDKLNQSLYEKQQKQSTIKAELDAAKDSALETERQIENLKRELSSAQAITSGGISASPENYISNLRRQDEITAELKEQEAILAQQDKTTQKLDAQYTRITDQVIKESAALNAAKTRAGELHHQIASTSGATEAMHGAMERVQKSVGKFSMRLREVIRSALIFTVISQSLAKLREWLGDVVTSNEEAAAAIARLRGALLTLAQPLMNVIIPAFTAFVNVLARVVQAIANVVSALFGTTIEESAEAAENLYNEQNAITELGDATKEASKSLASFDEINQLSSESASGAGAISSGGTSIAPDFGDFSSAEYKQKIDELTAMISGALLALGTILTFSGVNIPLGIALMAAGAIGLVSVATTNPQAIISLLQGPIGAVTALVSAALLAVGAILTFSGTNILLGIPLMALGAAGLAATVSVNWDTIASALRGPVGAVVAIVSAALLALGAVLTFSGASLPLGIGLMVAGAIGLATTVALNWDLITGEMSGVITEILVVVGAALLALGAILTFSGAALPLGIGLLIVGAASLAAAAALNWETLTGEMKTVTTAILLLVGAALLALGAILAFSGAALPLGIGLIAVGAASLAAAAALNWDFLTEKLRSIVTEILVIAGSASLAIGLILALTGVALPLGIALMAAGAASLITAAALNWDSLLNTVKKKTNELGSFFRNFLNWQTTNFENFLNFIIGGLNKIIDGFSMITSAVGNVFGFDWSIPNIPKVTLPRLAQGAVIPPNREFLAVLGDQKQGTNIEAPLSVIEQAVSNVMSRMGYGGEQTVILQVDKDQLGKVVYRLNKAETRRIGVSLAGV